MLKLTILSIVVTLAAAKPGTLIGRLISEKTIESHGNHVVHASAPVVYAAPAVAYAVAAQVPQSYVALTNSPVVPEKTAESQKPEAVQEKVKSSESTLSHQLPAFAYASPIYYSYPIKGTLLSEKTVSSYGHSIIHHGA